MNKTPLEEFQEAMFGEHVLIIAEITADMPRSVVIKELWNAAVLAAPPGAWDADGIVLNLADPDGGLIVYEAITYGDKRVIEAEGVVVCRILT